jgi:phytanoyl-CoA hydroxylase
VKWSKVRAKLQSPTKWLKVPTNPVQWPGNDTSEPETPGASRLAATMGVVESEAWMRTLPWIDRPDADIGGYVRGVKEDLDFDLEAKLVFWRDYGYVVFEQVVDHEIIDLFLADLSYAREHSNQLDLEMEIRSTRKPLASLTSEEVNSDGVKFNGIHGISKAAALLSVTPVVSQFLRHVLGEPPAALQSLTFFKGSQQPVHIDYPYVRTQKEIAKLAASWIPLEDIHPDSGPLAYYPGSHKIAVSAFYDWGRGSILFENDSTRTPVEFSQYLAQRLREADITPKVFSPRKGDVLLWHGNLMHGGSPIANDSLTRKSYVTHYTSLSAYPDGFAVPGAEPGHHCVSRGGGFVFEYPWVLSAPKLPSWTMTLP